MKHYGSLMVLLSFTASACSATGNQSTNADDRQLAESPVPTTSERASPASASSRAAMVLPTYEDEPGQASLQALVEGTLDVEGPCLYLQTETDRYLPIWPASKVEWNAGANSLRFDGYTYRAGETIKLGGGEIRGEPAGPGFDSMASGTAPAPDCDKSLGWLVAPYRVP